MIPYRTPRLNETSSRAGHGEPPPKESNVDRSFEFVTLLLLRSLAYFRNDGIYWLRFEYTQLLTIVYERGWEVLGSGISKRAKGCDRAHRGWGREGGE